MKKNIILLISLGIATLSLSSCVKASNAIYAINNVDLTITAGEDKNTIEVNAKTIVSMIRSGMSVPMYLYSPTCSYCEISSSTLSGYLKSKKYTVYSVEYTNENYAWLNNELPDVFPIELGTPRFMFFDNGELTYEVTTSKLVSKNGFKSVLNNHFKETKVYSATTNESVSQCIENNNNLFVFGYSSSNNQSLIIYNSYIKNTSFTSSKSTLLIDFNLLNDEEITSIYQAFNIDDDKYTFASVISGQEKTVLDYTTSNGLNNLLDSINSYFG